MKKTGILVCIMFVCTQISAQQDYISFNHQRINFSANPRTTISPMSLKLWDNYNNGGPTAYGTVLEIYGYSEHQTSQLYFGGWDNSRIRYRESFYGQNSWNEWVTLLDSKNDIETQGNLKISGSGNHYIANGNMGIGISSPQVGLHVAKVSTIGSDNVAAILGNDYNHWTSFGGITGGRIRGSNEGYLVVGSNPNGPGNKSLYLNYDTPGNIFMANGGGKVGIGVNKINDDALLTVNGIIHAKEINVSLEGLADYVFHPDYELMPLHKVEQFVKTNRHLPEIPSAADVKENGLNMGEMQNKLLQKIEELTLYMIEQQKRIEQLEKQINK